MTVLHALVFFTTTFRLQYRYRSRLFGWDDFWAIMSLAFDVAFFATTWIGFTSYTSMSCICLFSCDIMFITNYF